MKASTQASSAGSTSGKGKSLGLLGCICLCVLALAAFLGNSASAAVPAKGVTGFFGATGTVAGQLNTPRGVAVNQGSGNVYVVDGTNNRVAVFDSNGAFLRTFGTDVVASGPDQANEMQSVAVAATTGSFTLIFNGVPTSSLSATTSAAQVQSALNALGTINSEGGSVTVTGGPGNATGSTPYRIVFNGGPLAGADVPQVLAVNEGLAGGSPATTITADTVRPGAAGFEICIPTNGDLCKAGTGFLVPFPGGLLGNTQGIAINQTSGDVYITDQTARRVQQFDSNGNFIRAFGKDTVATGFPGNSPEASAVQTLTVTATGGKYTLAFGGKETGELSYNATAAEIQTALTGLTSIGAGNATVSETSPGVFKITFAGNLANNPEPLIVAASAAGEPLTGGTALVANTTTGSNGFEICAIANGDVCKEPPFASTGGAFAGTLGHLTIAPAGSPNAGNVLVADPANLRVQEFTAAGAFIRAFGWNVVKAGPSDDVTAPVNEFEVCSLAFGDACQAGVTGSGSGQFATGTPTRVAEDSSGSIYTVEPSTNFRVQKFTLPGNVVTPQGNFAEADLKGTAASNTPTDVAVNPSNNNVLVNKAFAAGATASCPITGSASVAESRVVEVSSAGALETTSGHHGTCAGMTPVNGLAVRGSSGNVYVSSTFGASRVYVLNTGQPVAPTLSITNISGIEAHGATINALINPNGPELPYGQETTYGIEYKRSVDAAFTKLSTAEASAGNRTASRAITVVVGSLQPGASYDVRLVANKGLGSGSASQTVSFNTKASAPDVALPTYVVVSQAQARLIGSVNPNGQPSGYRFEYIDHAGFEASGFAGATHVPASDVAVGSGVAPVAASQAIASLSAGETYHYRLLAANPTGQSIATGQFTTTPDPAGCPNAAIRAGQKSTSNPDGTGYLPTCMGLEMVSPPHKFNQKADQPSFAASGDTMKFNSLAALAGAPQLGTTSNPYVAIRSASGWSTHPTQTPPGLVEGAALPCSYNMDLTQWTISTSRPIGSLIASTLPYKGGIFTGFSPLGPALRPINSGLSSAAGKCEGGSADASRLFFSADSTTLLPGDPLVGGFGTGLPNQYEAYLDDEGNPTAKLFTRDKDGKLWGGACGAIIGWRQSAALAQRGAISTDGSRVFFTTKPGQGAGECSTANKFRVMGRLRTPAGPVIREVSVSECARVLPRCDPSDGDDNFKAASQEGGLVYFTTTRQLAGSDLDTGTACATSGVTTGCDLYLYDASRPSGAHLTQVSAGDGSAPTPGQGASVRGVLDVSGDGSHAYFVAEGVLTTSPNPLGAVAEAGKRNLYLYERDAAHPGGRIAFVGALATADTTLWGASGAGFGPGLNPAAAVPLLGSDPEDPSTGGDGHILVFLTQAALTPDDTDGTRADLYRYDAEGGSLQRISTAAPGGSDGGAFTVSVVTGRSGETPHFPQSLYFRRAVSEDGRTIAFATEEALDPSDADVAPSSYVWHDGAVTVIGGSLVDSGGELLPVASTSGDVGFVSGKQLLPEDGDSAKDVYVARVGGGFEPPVPPVPCQGEGCQEPFQAQPESKGAASESFSGQGNVKKPAPGCPKGKHRVKRKGRSRCVPNKAGKARYKRVERAGARDVNANGRAAK